MINYTIRLYREVLCLDSIVQMELSTLKVAARYRDLQTYFQEL